MAGVIGLSTERGDQLVVETLPFESTLNPEQLPPANPPPPPPPTWQDQFLKNKVFVIGAAVGAAMLLALLFIIVRLTRNKGRRAPVELPGGAARRSLAAIRSRRRSKTVWPSRRRSAKSRRRTL